MIERTKPERLAATLFPVSLALYLDFVKHLNFFLLCFLVIVFSWVTRFVFDIIQGHFQ